MLYLLFFFFQISSNCFLVSGLGQNVVIHPMSLHGHFFSLIRGGALCQAHPPVCMPKLRADGFLGSNCYKNHLPLFKMVMASNAKDSFSKGFVNKIRHGDMDGWVSLL